LPSRIAIRYSYLVYSAFTAATPDSFA
jgi:hypothetical protein